LVDAVSGQEGVIAILGLRRDGRTPLSSTYLKTKAVVVAAIGEDIPSLDVENGFYGIRARTGSSHATAIVSSLVAAKRGRESNASPKNLKAMLLGTAERYIRNCTDTVKSCLAVQNHQSSLEVIGRLDWNRFSEVSASDATAWLRDDLPDCQNLKSTIVGDPMFFKRVDGAGYLGDVLTSGLSVRNIAALFKTPTSTGHVQFDILSFTNPPDKSNVFTLTKGVQLGSPVGECNENPSIERPHSADCLTILTADGKAEGIDLKCVQQVFVRGQP
jgi:hypothetical protein